MEKITSFDLAGPNPRPMTVPEVRSLKELVASLPPDPIIVQIGADIGVSTVTMLEEREDAFIFSIDTGECPTERENLKKAGLETRRVVRVLGKSQEVGAYWPYRFHMLFVDGDHSESGVRGDIATWNQLVMSGGIIAFHDYIPEPIPDEIKGRVVYAVDALMDMKDKILWTDRLIAFRKP